jgi:hypothetical protein
VTLPIAVQWKEGMNVRCEMSDVVAQD